MAKPSRVVSIIGWILSILPVPLFLMSAYFKFRPTPEIKQATASAGWSGSTMLWIGVVELACVVLYLYPRTAVLGGVLLAGYLGGAIATHVRVGEPWFIPALIGIVLWLGLFLREPRLRPLLPWRR